MLVLTLVGHIGLQVAVVVANTPMVEPLVRGVKVGAVRVDMVQTRLLPVPPVLVAVAADRVVLVGVRLVLLGRAAPDW